MSLLAIFVYRKAASSLLSPVLLEEEDLLLLQDELLDQLQLEDPIPVIVGLARSVTKNLLV